jgi:hypothetical protein
LSAFTPTDSLKTAQSCRAAARLTMERHWRESVDDLFR